jgi:Ribbon-helix-helix protein, copG family
MVGFGGGMDDGGLLGEGGWLGDVPGVVVGAVPGVVAGAVPGIPPGGVAWERNIEAARQKDGVSIGWRGLLRGGRAHALARAAGRGASALVHRWRMTTATRRRTGFGFHRDNGRHAPALAPPFRAGQPGLVSILCPGARFLALQGSFWAVSRSWLKPWAGCLLLASVRLSQGHRMAAGNFRSLTTKRWDFPKGEPLVLVSIRVPSPVLARLDALARRTGRTRSDAGLLL